MTAPAESRVRAHQIFADSGNNASDAAIAQQLKSEGFGNFTRQVVGTWRRRHRWIETTPRSRQFVELGEEMRQAIQVRVPDDLDRVEQTSLAMSSMGNSIIALGTKMAEHIADQISKMTFESVEDLDRVIGSLESLVRSTSDLHKTQLIVGKALQDLRLLRVSSAFSGDGSRDGEIIPPDRKRERESEDPMTAMEAVISNFSH